MKKNINPNLQKAIKILRDNDNKTSIVSYAIQRIVRNNNTLDTNIVNDAAAEFLKNQNINDNNDLSKKIKNAIGSLLRQYVRDNNNIGLSHMKFDAEQEKLNMKEVNLTKENKGISNIQNKQLKDLLNLAFNTILPKKLKRTDKAFIVDKEVLNDVNKEMQTYIKDNNIASEVKEKFKKYLKPHIQHFVKGQIMVNKGANKSYPIIFIDGKQERFQNRQKISNKYKVNRIEEEELNAPQEKDVKSINKLSNSDNFKLRLLYEIAKVTLKKHIKDNTLDGKAFKKFDKEFEGEIKNSDLPDDIKKQFKQGLHQMLRHDIVKTNNKGLTQIKFSDNQKKAYEQKGFIKSIKQKFGGKEYKNKKIMKESIKKIPFAENLGDKLQEILQKNQNQQTAHKPHTQKNKKGIQIS